jgi:hypothetical protein
MPDYESIPLFFSIFFFSKGLVLKGDTQWLVDGRTNNNVLESIIFWDMTPCSP